MTIIIIIIIVAIAEVYKNEGNNEYNENNFNNAIDFYTEGIKVNCKDEELNAILYSNRAAARFNLGEKLLFVVYNILNFFLPIGICFFSGGSVTTAMNISSDYVSIVVKWCYAVPFSTSFPGSSPTRPRRWDTGNNVLPFWDVNRLCAFILSQVITLKH